MKTTIATAAVAAGLCALAGPVFAYTLNGTISGATAHIHLQQPIPQTGYVKLTFVLPQAVITGIPYAVGFCVGPTSNCFQTAQSIPGGQQINAIYDTRTIAAYGIWVNKGTTAPVPYTLDVNYLP
ncbi:MAG TPA: hypothetical protein VMQ54_04260 [Steroidobacteraceae bacterium]|jgi:hypothetical protein|nr:hypothetical protein [Steroidobacteraceae bacterium]